MYCYYRGGLTKSLQSELYRLEDGEVFYSDEDYNGFSGYEFIPDTEIVFTTDYYSIFYR